MSKTTTIKPPPFSVTKTKRSGLEALEKYLKSRLALDMKQYKWVLKDQARKDSEVACYYKERVQLLKKFIAETAEAKSKYNQIRI